MIKKVLLILIFMCEQVVFATVPCVNVEFFNRFNDPYLSEYIVNTMQNNHELKSLTYKVEQYRQQVKISFGHELPSLSVEAAYLGINVPRMSNFNLSKSAFVLPFVASYEPDFLLKNRDKTRGLKKAYEAAQQEQKAVYIALLTDVAANYINILQYDDLIAKQEKVVDISQEQYRRTEKKFNKGIINAITLNLAKQDLEKEKNILEDLKKQNDVILNYFATLIGISSDNIKDIKRGKLSNFEYFGDIPTQVKSDVIFSRPDVMEIEKLLEKSKIDVRVARKELLPSFNITGLWAFNTIASGSFFSWENSLAMLLAGASADIFKGGAKIANLRLQKAKYEEIFEQYRQTDLNAVKEVNTALCIIKYDTDIDKNTQKQLDYEVNNYKKTLKIRI